MLRSIRLTIKATCNMNLANFPMDDQLCTVEIESFGYTMADLRYLPSPVLSSRAWYLEETLKDFYKYL